MSWKYARTDASSDDGRLDALLEPSTVERETLPLASLPFVWLQVTHLLPRRGALPYLDGMALLLELALLGFADVPFTTGRTGRVRSGSRLVMGSPEVGNAAMDGALERLETFETPLDAQTAAVRIAPYVAALAPRAAGVDVARAGLREATIGAGPTDIRTALLVWMLKQDSALGGLTVAAIFPKGSGVTQRTLRHVGPDLYAFADDVEAAVAHRVLFALFRVPDFPATG